MKPIRKQCTDARLEKIQNAFDVIRLLDREMPGQVLSAFLYVAAHNGCHKQALEEELGYTSPSASRVTDILSEGRPGRESKGLGLITKTEDLGNRRRQFLHLTAHGEDIARTMKRIIYG